MSTWKSILESLKDVGSIIGIIVTIFGFIAGIIKPVRKKIIAWVRKIVNTDEHDMQMEKVHTEIQSLKDIVEAHNESIDRRFDDLAYQNSQLKEADYYTLGNVIREVYHENKAQKILSEHDYELCDKVYKLYHDEWKQNGPVEAMWSEMKKWEKIFD